MKTTCVGCNEVHESDRCPNCGVPSAPGGYRVERVLAQTAHSRMFVATGPDGTRVAVKELVFALVPGVEQLEAFDREVEVLESLEVAGVPRILASFTEGRGPGTRLYLVQEYVEGTSLADRLREGPMSEEETASIARRVLEILQRLHSRRPPVVHRDVKPANLIERSDGEIVLVDFGSARLLPNEVTYRSTLVGTYGYMPPEQLAGSVDPTADLYSLGATLAHLLSGRAPAELLRDGLVLEVDGRIPASPRFRRWLSRLLAGTRTKRFRSAAEALRALDALRAPDPAASALSNRLVLAVTGALVVLGVIALVAVNVVPVGSSPRLRSFQKTARSSETAPPRLPPAPGPNAARAAFAVASAPVERLPPLEIVPLVRVLPSGQHSAFWLDSGFTVDVPRRKNRRGYPRPPTTPTRSCAEAPVPYVEGYQVSLPSELASFGAQFDLRLWGTAYGSENGCSTIPMALFTEDGREMQRVQDAYSTRWVIPRNEPRFTLRFEVPGIDIGIDLEKRSIVLPR